MFPEADLLPLSALQHLAFCERQCALIHIEQQWEENIYTAEGRVLHERADEPEVESRGDLRIVRALKIRSLRLGLSGQADVVEFHRCEEPDGVTIPKAPGHWRPFPVEYKRGKPKTNRCDEVQLCAQALCLEEMLGKPVATGALFYGTTCRRLNIEFGTGLRAETERLAARLHELIASRLTPAAHYEKKCDSCSLYNVCRPKSLGINSATTYLDEALRETSRDAPREEPAQYPLRDTGEGLSGPGG